MKAEIVNNTLVKELVIKQVSYDLDSRETTIPYSLIGEGFRLDRVVTLSQEESDQWGDDDKVLLDKIIEKEQLETL